MTGFTAEQLRWAEMELAREEGIEGLREIDPVQAALVELERDVGGAWALLTVEHPASSASGFWSRPQLSTLSCGATPMGHYRIVPLQGYEDAEERIYRDYRTTATVEGPAAHLWYGLPGSRTGAGSGRVDASAHSLRPPGTGWRAPAFCGATGESSSVEPVAALPTSSTR